MAKIGIVYYSRGGNTKKMAQEVLAGIEESDYDAEALVKETDEVDVDELLGWDGIVVGSPTYYGLPAAEIKDLFDQSVKHHGELEGMIGGAFTSSANRGGGNETTLIGIIEMMLIHGMIVKGFPSEDHYGPVAIGSPDQRAREGCRKLGREVARLATSLSG